MTKDRYAPIPDDLRADSRSHSEKLAAALAFLGTRYVFHPDCKLKDPRKMFKAMRKAQVRRAEKVKRKSVGGSKPRKVVK